MNLPKPLKEVFIWQALIGIGLILFIMAFAINVVAHLLVARVVKSHEGAVLA